MALEEKAFRLVVLLFMLSLCLASMLPAGCGKPGQAVDDVGEGTETEEPAAGSSADESAPSYSFDNQMLGSGPGADLLVEDVRWSDHGDHYRFVFELKTDGAGAGSLPETYTYYVTPDKLNLNIYFLSAGVSDTRFLNVGDQVPLGDSPVTAIKRSMGGSGLETTFTVIMAEPLRHYLHYAADPMQVILDIEKG